MAGVCVLAITDNMHQEVPPRRPLPPHCDAPQAERMAIPCREMMDVDGRSLIT